MQDPPTLDFFDRFRHNLEKHPEQLAFQNIDQEGRQCYSYRQVAQEVGKISLFLQQQHIGPGDSVGILMENHPRWGIAFLAAQSAGARIVPFDILHTSGTLAHLIQHSECKFLISSVKLAPRLEEIQGLLPRPLPSLINGGQECGWDTVLSRISESPSLPLVESDLDDPFVIIYTSGTTGNPKGVVLTRRSLYRNVVEVQRLVGVGPEDRVLSVLPLYHILALMTNFIIPLYAGSSVTYLDSIDSQRILQSFQEEGITIFVCVPQFYYLVHRRIVQQVDRQSVLSRFLFWRLLALSRFCIMKLNRNPGRFFFSTLHKRFGSRLRLFAVGGARFDPEVARFFRDLGFTLLQAYGMTETSAVATVAPLEGQAVGSVGVPLPHAEVCIAEPDDTGVGEILIRGENIMQGYWKNPSATRAALKDDWMHSGDLGFFDSHGYLHVTGRKKDVIVLSSGKNIYPEELEHYYQSHCPFIKEMCVLGVVDPGSREQEEKLHAVLVPDFEYMKSQQIVNAQDMIRYTLETLSQSLPASKRVHSFEIRREPLPRTTTRKIKRFQVARELEQATPESALLRFQKPAHSLTPTEETICRIIQEMKKAPLVVPTMNLELDLGFDSLERVEFLSTVQETFQVRIPDERAAQIFTVADLVDQVRQAMQGGPAQEKEALQSWSAILREPLQPEEQEKVEEILKPRLVSEIAFYLAAKITYLLARLLFRLKVKGVRELPRSYPYLICPNHLSFLDAFMVVAPLPFRIIRRIFFLGYSDYFSGSLTSFLGRLIKVVPVDSDFHLRRALRLGAEGLRRNLILCVFPEGERSIDGSLKPFRKGPAILAKELNVPVVPVAILGTYEAWARGVSKIRLQPVRVTFGEPVPPSGAGQSYESLNEDLHRAVQSLLLQEKETPPTDSAEAATR